MSETSKVAQPVGDKLPTAPCSVVWSRGHAYVLEPVGGRSRWMGVDDKGRAVALSGADLQHRGWSRTCKR
ncbi:MAG TPA: hypothetical protein VFX16_01665 [Pseudonocardiaceae bacterium]|nr:hypothetical protein [Pseudonocardiaceae bacterium]